MAFDGQALARATERYRRDVSAHETALRERTERLQAKYPRLRAIGIEMRQTMIGVASAALADGNALEAQIERARARNTALRAERAALLRENGLPPDSLDTGPRCPACGDEGYIDGAMCPCLREYYKREQREELDRRIGMPEASFQTLELGRFAVAKDPVYRLSPRQNMEYVQKECRRFASGAGAGLFIRGGAGVGKTFMAACIAHEALEAGVYIVYETAINLMLRFDDERFRREESVSAAIARYMNCELFVLDDLGQEPQSAYSASSLFRLLDSRIQSGGRTAILSSLGDEELIRRYGAALFSRLTGGFTELSIFGADLRKRSGGAYNPRVYGKN